MSTRPSRAHSTSRHRSLARALGMLALAATLLALAGARVVAQPTGHSSFGRHFIVAFPDTTQSHTRVLLNTLETTATLTLVSLDTARVTLSAPGFVRTVTVVPERTTTVSLTDAASRPSKLFVDSLNTPLPWSVDIRSDELVAVTAYFATIHGAEAFTPVPVERWGREYFAASLNQWFVYNALQIEEKYTFVGAQAALLVVAAEDNTDVTIDSRTAVVGPATRTVTLDAGEVYLVETAIPSTLDSLALPDLSGTRITSSKPVGVISGNTRTLGSRNNPIPLDPLPTNAMSNTAYEWLHPVDDHGHTFIYRQFSAVDERVSTELVRVYATSPGFTTVTLTHGPPMGMLQGEFLEFSSRAWRSVDSVIQPFGIRTDKPAQAFVVTGSSASLMGTDPSTGLEMETNTWSPAMAELVPRERWITLGRYNAPSYPGGTAHYVVVAADSGTTVLLDGQPITFDATPVVGTSFRHARVPVAAGDHTLRSTGGRFTATAFGQRRGYAAFRPFKANDGGGDPPDGVAAHPTYYLEILSVAYAMPVPGVSDLVAAPDSLTISRLDRCDSTVVTANRAAVTWSSSIIEATLDAGSVNADVTIDKTFNNRLHLGFRIRFRPIDPSRDASASVTVRNDAGQSWTIPWSYRAHTVAIDPPSIELLAVPVGETRTIPLTLTNVKPFTTTVLDVRLAGGASGFRLLGREVLPKPLASGGSFGMTLEFTGTEHGRLYVDTLIVVADCDTMHLPVSARTEPPEPAPIPLITGYDWGVRRVASVNDTLSFVSNAGTLPFTTDHVAIVGDVAGAFFIVGDTSIPAVEPAARHPLGIRFVPPTEGDFVAEIVLVTTDGDSARAELRGIGRLARIDVEDLALAPLCVGQALDTFIDLRASGSLPTRVDSLVVTAPALVRVELDTTWLGLPREIAPDSSLRVRVRLVGLAPGSLTATIAVHADATGDTLALVTGEIIACIAQGIVATDHDFDTVLVTRSRAGSVWVINTGDVDVTVERLRIVDDAEGSFRLDAPLGTFTVARGDSVEVHATFTPPTVGPKSARIEYETTAGILYSALRGVGARLVVPARIPRAYRGEPGTEQTFAVILERPADVAGAGPIAVSVEYAAELLDFVALRDTAVSQTDLRLVGVSEGRVDFELLPRGDSLREGPIAALRFLVRIAMADSSELPLAMTTTAPWLEFTTRPGLFVRFPWCGLAERMFEFTAGEIALRPVRPNPVRGEATIEFAIPFDAEARLVILDATGAERLRLGDGPLAAGAYAAALPAGTLSPGAYFARLTVAGMQRLVRFVVQ